MPYLRVLGGLDLRDDDGRDVGVVLAQPKRAALLAYLCLRSAGGPCRRDTLLALFWPESGAERARAALRAALHFLRRSLGSEVIVTRGDDEVWVDPGRLRCDAVEFAERAATGQAGAALALYRGDLLRGVHLDGLPELERWLDEERDRLRRIAAQAATALASEAEAAGGVTGALQAARRATELAPDDEAVTRRMLMLLDRAGDRAGALRLYDALSARLATEFAVEPAPETRALVAQIRARASEHAGIATNAAAATAVSVPPPAAYTPLVDAPHSSPALPAAPLAARELERPVPAVIGRPRRRAAIGAGVVAVAAIGAVLVWRGALPAAAPPNADVVAVLPFAYHGGAALSYLGDGLPRLIGSNLNGAGQLRTIDPVAVQRLLADLRARRAEEAPARAVADRFGAGMVVSGEVIESGGRVRIVADIARGNGSAEQVVVERGRDSVFALVDEMTARLVATWGEGRGRRLTSLAARTTRSPQALRAYLEGERAYAAGHYAEAVDGFERAVAIDSQFALAYYRLSVALPWTVVPRTGNATLRARHFVASLTGRDSLLVEARYANAFGDPTHAEALYRRVLADHPAEVEAWLQLGEVQYHWGPMIGRAAGVAEDAFAHAVALDPANVPALTHLARLAASDGRATRLDSLRARIALLAPNTDEAIEVDVLAASAAGVPSATILARLGDAGEAVRERLVLLLAATTGDLATARALAQSLDAPARDGEHRAAARLLLAELEAAGGRWRAARAALDRYAELRPGLAAQYRAALDAASPLVAPPHGELATARAALMRAPVDTGAPPALLHAFDPVGGGLIGVRRAYLLARLAVRDGDSTASIAARSASRATSERSDSTQADLARRLEAEVLARTGAAAAALDRLGPPRVPLTPWLPKLPSFASADERWLRAELLRSTGRDAEALRWYETFPDPSGYDVVYAAATHLARARLHDRRGERAAAAEQYRRFIAAWHDADADLRPLVDDARRRLSAVSR